MIKHMITHIIVLCNLGHFLVKNTLGDAVSGTPAHCADICDVTEKCLGFNYFLARGR